MFGGFFIAIVCMWLTKIKESFIKFNFKISLSIILVTWKYGWTRHKTTNRNIYSMTEVKFYLFSPIFQFQRKAVANAEKNVLNEAEFELGSPECPGGAWPTRL